MGDLIAWTVLVLVFRVTVRTIVNHLTGKS